MNKIAIYGAGGFGREVLLMIRQINQVHQRWEVTGFFDDGKPRGTLVDGVPVLGGILEVNTIDTPLSLVMAVADPHIRKKIVSEIKNPQIGFPVLVHPSAQTGSGKNIFGKGTIITAGVICTTAITLGEFVIVNLAVTVGHDVEIGAWTTVMPGSHISGYVQIGEGVLVGTGASVLQNLTIGSHAKIGAGAVVIGNVPPSATVVGVPARERGKTK